MTNIYTHPHPIGKRLLLIGQASHGPYFQPTLIATPEKVQSIFGGGLSRAFQEAYYAGAHEIWLMRCYDFTTPEEAYFSLQEAYDSILGAPIDCVVPVGVHAGTPVSLIDKEGRQVSFARQLAAFCYKGWQRNTPCIGVIQDRLTFTPLPFFLS